MTIVASARRTVAAIALALSLVTALSGSAEASTDYTPSGGPSVNLVGTKVGFYFEETGQAFTCTRFDIAGQVVTPGVSRTLGSEVVDLGALTDRCTNPFYGLSDFRVEATWHADVTGVPTGASWPIRLNGVEMAFAAPGCVVEFEGTVDGTFDTSAQRLTPLNSALVVTSWSGPMCVTLDFQVGDHVSLLGHFTNVPPAGSSPLSLS